METAAASASGAGVFRIAERQNNGLTRGLGEKKPVPATVRRSFSGAGGLRAGDKAMQHYAFLRQRAAHDVSNQVTAAEGGRCRGSVPRSKNSMMAMCPPQQGQGGKTASTGGSSLGLASSGSVDLSSSRNDAVRVARQISEHGLGAGEGALGIDEPVFPAQRFQEGGERMAYLFSPGMCWMGSSLK
jgi:hypothetical protein